MSRYPALIRVNDDASYDVTFPDLPSVTAAGPSLDDALDAAAGALQAHLDANDQAPEPFAAGEPDATGAMLTLIEGAHRSEAPKLAEIMLMLDARLLARIDEFRAAQGFATREMFFTHIAQNALQRPVPRADSERREFKPRSDRPQREDFEKREPRASTQFFRDGDKKRGGSFKPRRDDEAPRNPRRNRPESEGGFEDRPKRAYRSRDESASERPRREFKPRRSEEGEDRPRRSYAPRGDDSGERPRKSFGERKPFGDKKPYGKASGFGGKGGGSKGGGGFRKGPRRGE
jgi:predicted RNase H-like HicB family nuclease